MTANSKQVAELVARLREIGAHYSACDRQQTIYASADALASMQGQIDAAEAKVVELEWERDEILEQKEKWVKWAEELAVKLDERATLTAALDEAKRLAASARSLALEEAAKPNLRMVSAALSILDEHIDSQLGGNTRHRIVREALVAAIRSLASQGSAEDPRPGETEQEERT